MGVNATNRLYVRVSFKIVEELQIKALHPDIKQVVLARQKNARWCHIEFANNEKCLAAFKHLRKVKINGKTICVKPAKPIDHSYLRLKCKKSRNTRIKTTESAN